MPKHYNTSGIEKAIRRADPKWREEQLKRNEEADDLKRKRLEDPSSLRNRTKRGRYTYRHWGSRDEGEVKEIGLEAQLIPLFNQSFDTGAAQACESMRQEAFANSIAAWKEQQQQQTTLLLPTSPQ